MTRLVGVRAVCDGCSGAAAAVFCVSHRSVLCHACDARQHPPPVAAAHQRVDLASAVTALPFCEYCDDAPATTYCATEGTTLCDKCDRVVHASHPLAHYRTPISSTLRNRAVEFRGGHRPRSSPEPSFAPSKVQKNHTVKQQIVKAPSAGSQQHQPPLQTAQELKTQPPSQPQVQRPPTPAAQSRVQSAQRRRSSKLLAKRKHRRDPQRTVPQVPTSRSSLERIPPPPSAAPDLVDSYDYPGFLCPTSLPPADLRTASASSPYSTFPMETPGTHHAFNDPLLVDPNAQFRQSQDRAELNPDSPGLCQDFNNIVTYGSIDLSGDTALEGFDNSGRSRSGTASGESSWHKTPDFDVLPRDTRSIPNGAVPSFTQSAVAAVAAAAAAAAGEMYLLHSVSSGSGSSRERLTPPLNDVNRVPDPAGVAEAATAAAESAVAAVDLGGATVAQQQAALVSKPSHLAAEAVAEALGAGRAGKAQRSVRRLADPVLSSAGATGAARGNQLLLAQRQTFDEAVRKLDMDSNASRSGRFGSKGDSSLNRPRQEPLTNRSDGNTDLLAPMSDTDEMLRRGPDGIGDLEMPRDDFGVFDSIDLSQFEHNGSGGLGFSLPDYRSRVLDSDEG